MPAPETRGKTPPAVKIGHRRIGADEPVYVIAEAGVCHNGDGETALRMVEAAAKADADAVKFQVFTAEELTTWEAPTADYQQSSTGELRQGTMLARLELSDAVFLEIRARCEALEIDFLATPFSSNDVARLTPLDPPAIKIASTDVNNVRLLEAVALTGLPLIVSTGAATLEEIVAACAYLEALDARDRLMLMHCVSAYPAPLSTLNLRAIGSMTRDFGLNVGFSDHAASPETGAWAVAHGAVILEKHFTLDRNQSGPDHAMSLEPAELASYIRLVREMDAARGDGAIGMCDAEHDVRAAARRSVVAACDIVAGDVIQADMLTLKRPGTGIVPTELSDLIGLTAAVDISRDAMLSWEMVR